MRTFLVTGGAGFIGSHITDALVKRGDRVRVLDNLTTGRLENLADVVDQVEFIEGDIADPETARDAVAGVDVVFHQAALASVQLSVDDPYASHTAGATGTLALLEAAQKAGVTRFVYAASSSAYGNQPHAANRETDRCAPLSPYAVAKLSGELYCQAFYHTFGLETVCLRYFNVFGPRQDPDSPYSAVIPLFITAMLQGKSPTVFGDGKQSRDFTFIENIVLGNLLAADAPTAAGKSLNLATGKTVDLLTLIAHLNEMLGTDLPANHEPPRLGDVRESMADITLARKLLGYEPVIDFEQGLRQSIDYYRSTIEAEVLEMQ